MGVGGLHPLSHANQSPPTPAQTSFTVQGHLFAQLSLSLAHTLTLVGRQGCTGCPSSRPHTAFVGKLSPPPQGTLSPVSSAHPWHRPARTVPYTGNTPGRARGDKISRPSVVFPSTKGERGGHKTGNGRSKPNCCAFPFAPEVSLPPVFVPSHLSSSRPVLLQLSTLSSHQTPSTGRNPSRIPPTRFASLCAVWFRAPRETRRALVHSRPTRAET